jgi:hypothetical protein
MLRNLKNLGLAFVAALAISASAVPAAQAQPTFTCSAYPCAATGSNTKGSETFTTSGGMPQCDSHFLIGQIGGGNIQFPASKVTVTPSYDNCEAFGFFQAAFHENGCDYVFTATEQVAMNQYRHHVDLICPSGSPGFTITAGTCEVDILPQSNLTTVVTTNLSSGSVTVQQLVANMTMNVTKDGFGCAFSGTGHTTSTYHGDVVLSRVDGGSISVSGE